MSDSLTGNTHLPIGYKTVFNYTLCLLLGTVVFIMTRQFPFDRFSFLMNLALLGVFGISVFHIYSTVKSSTSAIKTLLYCIINLIGVYVLIAICVYQHPIALVFRFTLILLLITLAYFIRPPSGYLPIFNAIVVIEAFFVIAMELGMLVFFNEQTYLPVRFFFLSHGWGDLFTYNGWFYYIEIRGTAILPFAYMLNYVDPGKKHIRFRRIVLLLGVIFSGNFAYLIGVAFFHFFWFFRARSVRLFKTKAFKAVILLTIIALPCVIFVSDTLKRKQEESLGTRYDQVEVLFKDLCTSVGSLFAGRGLGNTIEVKTAYRDYSGDVYYELQALYFLNQMGIVLFLLFVGYNIMMTFYNYNQNKWIILIYISYVIYAATNPYLLDTTQIIVILTLNSLVDFNRRGACR